jgi:hypothetical protein
MSTTITLYDRCPTCSSPKTPAAVMCTGCFRSEVETTQVTNLAPVRYSDFFEDTVPSVGRVTEGLSERQWWALVGYIAFVVFAVLVAGAAGLVVL